LLLKGGRDGVKAKTTKTKTKQHIMTKSILRGIAVAAMAGLALIGRAQDTNIDQSQYPTILTQPDDLCLAVGDTATFSVVATNADSYQWYKNNVAMDGQTNSSVTIPNLGINDVGYYSALVNNSVGSVPTRSAGLNVYIASSTASTSTKTSKTRLSTMSTMMAGDLGGGGVVTVFGFPVVSSGNSGGCPGAYAGYVNFTKAITNGWGWAPSSTNTTLFIATDNNRADTKIQYVGKYGDIGCNATSVTVPYPAPSPKYRFTIFFTSNAPTNAYAITLTGFDQ
jgi:hypothetical protein